MNQQANFDNAASKVADLEKRLREATHQASLRHMHFELMEIQRAQTAKQGAALIASGIQLADSSDWKAHRRGIAKEEQRWLDFQPEYDAWDNRVITLTDELHDAKLALDTADKALTIARHDAACAAEAKAAASFLAAGDAFYAAHCELAAKIDARIRLRNKVNGMPAHIGGGYPVEVLLTPPQGATFTTEQLMRRPAPPAGANLAKGRAA